ncbi:hypothetical protein BpHYR1_005571, partial [Brachionus plicatilis]
KMVLTTKQVSLYDRAFLDSLPSLTISEYNDEIAAATRNAMFKPVTAKNAKRTYRKTPAFNVAKKRVPHAKMPKSSDQLSTQNFQNDKRVFYIKYFKIDTTNLYEPNTGKNNAIWQDTVQIRTEFKSQAANLNQNTVLKYKPSEGKQFLFIQKPSRPDQNQRYFIRRELKNQKFNIKSHNSWP